MSSNYVPVAGIFSTAPRIVEGTDWRIYVEDILVRGGVQRHFIEQSTWPYFNGFIGQPADEQLTEADLRLVYLHSLNDAWRYLESVAAKLTAQQEIEWCEPHTRDFRNFTLLVAGEEFMMQCERLLMTENPVPAVSLKVFRLLQRLILCKQRDPSAGIGFSSYLQVAAGSMALLATSGSPLKRQEFVQALTPDYPWGALIEQLDLHRDLLTEGS